MAEAMNLVRQELGEDAIIVSTQRSSDGQGVRITAALEAPDGDENITRALAGENTTPFSEGVREALTYHGVPARLIEKMVMTARSVEVGSPTMACAAAPRPFMLVGPPGSGKTITVAKLAARARLAGRPVGVITIDTIRAGAVEQLTAFTKILEVEIHQVRGTDTLPDAVATMIENYDLVFIDSPGLNPFSHHDMNYLKALTHSADIEPILVLAAGGDAGEAADIGESFSACGATRILATRLDMTRRLGSILAAADAGQLMFSEVSINPHVATGLCAINPVSMARMILPPDKDLQPAHFEDNNTPERPEGHRTEVS